MRVDIWSDIVCPFCYLGKRKFEKAVADFDGKEQLQVVWRSFQLDPELKNEEGKSVHEYLAERKGVTLAQAKQMNRQMAALADEEGLDYQFDKAIINNTLNAHRLLHYAKEKGVQRQLKELLFAAYYNGGKDIGDDHVLAAIAEEAGMDKREVLEMLSSDAFVEAVRADQQEAAEMGARGVPFFVFNNRYAVSGAQPTAVFQRVLEKIREEESEKLSIDPSAICSPDGTCN